MSPSATNLIERVMAKADALAPGERLRIPTLFANGITMGRTTGGKLFYVDGCTPMCNIRRRGDARP